MEARLHEIIDYLLRFLLGQGNEDFASLISYSTYNKASEDSRLIIIPSAFFDNTTYGSSTSAPSLPLANWDDVPLLFGSPQIEYQEDKIILYADIVASAFFLLTRYEEVINRDVRDEHGRFPGIKSLPFRSGFLHRCVVDEYGKGLRKLLRNLGIPAKEPEAGFCKIYLTHDVDQIAHYRHFRGVGGALLRSLKNPYQAFKAIRTFVGGVKYDPWFTFPWMFELTNELSRTYPHETVESIAFIKAGGGESIYDKPIHNLYSEDFSYLFQLCKANHIKIGLHPSYFAGQEPSYITVEKQMLDDVAKQNTVYSRNHFLRNREPEDFHALIAAGLTDDFTMGYADVAGFRLGTCRSVQWIDPITLTLTPLTLHPLTLMDGTLSDSRYMNLTVDKAFTYTKEIIDQVKIHGGHLNLLWHNTSTEEYNDMYHRELYQWMINYLKKR